jgi:hypothetical protein
LRRLWTRRAFSQRCRLRARARTATAPRTRALLSS